MSSNTKPIEQLEGNVTPEYLLSHGFFQYYSPEETGIFETPFENKEDLHFMEKDKNRNMFVVIFSERLSDDEGYDHQIYIQDDAGCGFIPIPERWWDLPIKYFEALHYAITGETTTKI